MSVKFDKIVVSSKEALVSDMIATAVLLAVKDGGCNRYGTGIVFRREPTEEDISDPATFLIEGETVYHNVCESGAKWRELGTPHMIACRLAGIDNGSSVFPWWFAYGGRDVAAHGIRHIANGEDLSEHISILSNPLTEGVYSEWNDSYGSGKPVGYPLEGWLVDLGTAMFDKASRFAAFDKMCKERPIEYDWSGVPLLDYSWVDPRDLDLVECRAHGLNRVVVTPHGDGEESVFDPRGVKRFNPDNAGIDHPWFKSSAFGKLVTSCPATPRLIQEIVDTCLEKGQW